MHEKDKIIDVEIIDVEEVDGVYQQTPRTAKKQQYSKPVKPQQANAQITHTYKQQSSNIEDILYGFNEGVRLINRFIKLIR